jgi:hypothetical protein
MEGGVMLKEYLDFERDAGLLAEFEEIAKCYSSSCVFADVQYRTGVMHSAIKAAFPAKAVGQALTFQLCKGDLVDLLKALEMGRCRSTSSSASSPGSPASCSRPA